MLVLTPEKVAEHIVRLAKEPRRWLVLPKILSVAPWLNLIWLGLIDWFAVHHFVRKEWAADLMRGSLLIRSWDSMMRSGFRTSFFSSGNSIANDFLKLDEYL